MSSYSASMFRFLGSILILCLCPFPAMMININHFQPELVMMRPILEGPVGSIVLVIMLAAIVWAIWMLARIFVELSKGR
ncbi:MAG: hypothetical protein Q8O19_01025 [Rectinemataceae bacterium]|nr:hypothetical protein [Rectinemataceae bacterium]